MFEYRQYLYASSSEALQQLKEKGYDLDFNLVESRLSEHPNDFKIIYIFRYEGDSSAGDSSYVFGIECVSTGEKGVFVMGNPADDHSEAGRVLIDLEIEGRLYS